jgi:hypothetical protein
MPGAIAFQVDDPPQIDLWRGYSTYPAHKGQLSKLELSR